MIVTVALPRHSGVILGASRVGVTVARVVPGSAASRESAIRTGDVIFRVCGACVLGDPLAAVVRRIRAASGTVRVDVWRSAYARENTSWTHVANAPVSERTTMAPSATPNAHGNVECTVDASVASCT